MPVTLAIETVTGEQRFVVENSQRQQTVTLHVATEPVRVRFDPDGALLRNDGTVVDFLPFDAPETLAYQVMPNPTDGRFQVRGTLPETGPLRVDVIDLLGRRIQTLWDGTAVAGPLRLDANLNRLAAGVYFVRMHHQTTIQTQPFVVVR